MPTCKAEPQTRGAVYHNYPETGPTYLGARDAALSRVKRHIPAAAGAAGQCLDVIAAVQNGFIGAWGRVAYLVNKLTTPTNKAAVRDALLQAVPASRQLQVRYPGDLAAWFPTPPASGTLLAPSPTAAARIGQHNDCFPQPRRRGYLLGQHAQQSARCAYAQQTSATTGAGAKPAPHRGSRPA